jgi:Bacterial regulatory helix-turn-helix protein, lysR family
VEEVTDEPLYRDRVCGIDIGKAGMAATIRVPSDKDPSRRMQETREFGTLPAAPVQEQLARLRLIELLTGTHPRYLPGPLRLPERRSQDYAGIRVRHGITGRAHPLAALGGPSAFTPDVWNAFSHPGAEQRIRRLLAIPGQSSLQRAARQLGIRHALLAGQVRQLEAVVGTELLRTGPDERLTLTAYGRIFARDVAPVLESLAQSRSQATRHTP